jgi:hypothetical protein
VNIARPNDIPENRYRVWINLGRSLVSSTSSIVVSMNGNIMESRTTLRAYHVEGITAKRSDENKATAGLNLLSDILYIRKVSTTAIEPIINRGIVNSDSMDDASDVG